MLYCPKCQLLTDSDYCPSCGTKKLRAPNPNDPVMLVTVDEVKAELIKAVFEDHQQIYEERIFGLGGPPSVIFGRTAITNKNIFVPFSEVEQAQSLLESTGIFDPAEMAGDESEQEEQPGEEESSSEEEPEELSAGKRMFFRILSVVLFILAVWGVVAISDFAANALKDLLPGLS